MAMLITQLNTVIVCLIDVFIFLLLLLCCDTLSTLELEFFVQNEGLHRIALDPIEFHRLYGFG
jgi:hypothetical protein